MRNRRFLAHLALFIAALIYGANYIIAKGVMTGGYLEPAGFILLRVIAGTMLFWLIHMLFFREKVKRRDLPLLAACGLFGVAVNQLSFFEGLKLTSPINASIIMISTPILVILISAIFTKSPLTLSKGVGVLIGGMGAGLIIWSGSENGWQGFGSMGDALVFVNATSYAIYLVLVKGLMSKYHPITIMKWVFFFGLCYISFFGFNDLLNAQWSSFTISVWWAIFYVLIFTTFFAYLLNVTAIQWVSPGVVSVYIYLQPLIATLLSLSFTQEHLSQIQVLAGVMIGFGVYLVSYGFKPKVKIKRT